MGFLEWYMREYEKQKTAYDEQQADNRLNADRIRRFWEWYATPEARSLVNAETVEVFESPDVFPDTVCTMPSGRSFSLSSASARVSLVGYYDPRDGLAAVTLHRADGTQHTWTQGMPSTMLVVGGKGPLDQDEWIAATLLRSNIRDGWPGRAIKRIDPDQQTIAKKMWEKISGEKLRSY